MKILTVLLLCAPLLLMANSSERISYQGRLLNVDGSPIAGPVDMTFRIYLNASATEDCSQAVSAVALSQGVFAVELTFPTLCSGASKTLVQFLTDAGNNGDSVYMEITDDTNVKTYGKQMITATPYAFVAKEVGSEGVANTALMGIPANCGLGEVVKTNGLGSFYCALDDNDGGDVTSVVAGTGLAGGGTTGDVTLSIGTGVDVTNFADGSIGNNEFQFLDGVTSNIQNQLDSKQSGGSYQAADDDLDDLSDGSLSGSKVGSGINSANIADGTIANTEFQYLDGVTSAIQTQLNAKQALDADLTDLADGSLSGSKVGSGINATNITTGTVANARLDADLQDLADSSLTATKIANGSISNTEFQYLNGVTSAIQTQLNAKQALDADLTDLADGSLSGSKVGSGINSANIANGTISNTEFQYLNGVTSAIQTQLNAKQALDADLTDLADGSLSGSKVGSGINATKIANGSISNTEFQYLNGVTSAIQTQLNSKQASGSYQPADADLTDLADGTLSASKVEYSVNSAGTSGQVWKSDGAGRGAWGTDTNTWRSISTSVSSTSTTVSASSSAAKAAYDLASSRGVPTGAVMFFNLAACPSGWSELTTSRGRYLVGKPNGGTLNGAAGTALSNVENRAIGQHNHSASSGSINLAHTHSHDHASTAITVNANGSHTHTTRFDKGSGIGGVYSLASVTDTGDSYPATSSAGNHTHSGSVNLANTTSSSTLGSHNHTVSVSNNGSVAGTNAPYLQLLVCQKN